MKIAIVLPSHRFDLFSEWLKAWKPQFDKHGAEVYFVEDRDEKTKTDLKHHFYRGDFPDFIPTATGSCRSFGLLKAYQDECDIIITLDHDCMPAPDVDLIQEYMDAFDRNYAVSDYYDVGHTFGLDEYMRGYPFLPRDNKRPLLQYGGWDNVPDLDAVTQMLHEQRGKVEGFKFDRRTLAMPSGVGFTGCAMNVAMKREAVPLLYQLIMGVDRVGYDRWDDIWSGLFAKKVCDNLNIPILINGRASIVHTRLSNTQENLTKEQAGYKLNEDMWDKLKQLKLDGKTTLECYESLTNQLNPDWFGDKGELIIRGMKAWIQTLGGKRIK